MLMQNQACCVCALRCACNIQSARNGCQMRLLWLGACMAYQHVNFFVFLKPCMGYNGLPCTRCRLGATLYRIWATLAQEAERAHC
jgi:hypothetical protein